MTQSPHPPADLRVALRGNCVRNPGLFLLFLHALLATLLGRPHAPAWRSLLAASAAGLPTGNAMDEWDDGYEWDDQDPTTQGYWSPRRHWHADCDPSILYVIGPPPNRGMRVLPRPIPAQRPRTARAPPARRKRSAGSAASGRKPPGLSTAL